MSWNRRERESSGILLSLIMVGLVGMVAAPNPENYSWATGSVLIFGVPLDVIATYLGSDVRLADIVEIQVNGEWWNGKDFAQSLRGQTVQSGNVYRIGIGAGSEDPVKNMDDEGIEFPLRVIMVDNDSVRFGFGNSANRLFTHYTTISYMDRSGELFGPGLVLTEANVWLGYYVLSGGIMTPTLEGWAPTGSETDGKVRIDSVTYDCSIVVLYTVVPPGWS